MKRLSILALCGTVAGLCTCEFPTADRVCAGVGYYALVIEIRDADGEPQALDAQVELIDGSYHELDSANTPLRVLAANERGGRTYDIRVSKTYYNDVVIRNVKTRGGGCVTGRENPPVTITLTLAPGAPAIRSVHLQPPSVWLDRASSGYSFEPFYSTTFTPQPYVDANPGVSRSLTWHISGDTASVSLDAVTGRLVYRCLPKSGSVKLTGTSVVDSSLSGEVDVVVRGHPNGTNDPPCSG